MDLGCLQDVGKGREHDRMDLGTPLWGVREVERPKGFATRHAGSQSRGAEAYPLEGCAQDAYTDVGGRVMQEQLPSGLLILSLRFHKKAVTLAHSAHEFC